MYAITLECVLLELKRQNLNFPVCQCLKMEVFGSVLVTVFISSAMLLLTDSRWFLLNPN